MLSPTKCLRHHSKAICDHLNQITISDSNKILPKLPDDSIDLVIEDAPYGIDFKLGWRRKKIPTTDGIANDKNNTTMLDQHLTHVSRVLKPNSHLYWFTRWDKSGEHIELLKSHGFSVKNALIWEKDQFGMGDLNGAYANQYEVVLFAQKGSRPLNCLDLPDGQKTTRGRTYKCRHTDILRYERPNTKTMLHNHQKPEELIQFLIQKSSKKGDVILDGFLGSGSTAIAAQNTDRNWIGIEIDPTIAQIAQNRLKGK